MVWGPIKLDRVLEQTPKKWHQVKAQGVESLYLDFTTENDPDPGI